MFLMLPERRSKLAQNSPRIVAVLVLAVAAIGFYSSFPELRRYLRMRQM